MCYPFLPSLPYITPPPPSLPLLPATTTITTSTAVNHHRHLCHRQHHHVYPSVGQSLGIQQAFDKPPVESESYQQRNCLFHLSLWRNWDRLSRCILQAFPWELSKCAPVTPISGWVLSGQDWGLCCRPLPALTGWFGFGWGRSWRESLSPSPPNSSVSRDEVCKGTGPPLSGES